MRRGKKVAAVALARKRVAILFALWRNGTLRLRAADRVHFVENNV